MRYLTILLFFIALSACAQKDITADWTFQDREEFSLKHPADWTPDFSGLMGTKMIVFSPTTSEQDNFQENVNVLIEELPSEIGLEDYASSAKQQVANFMTDVDITVDQAAEGKSGPYHKLAYTASQGVYSLQFLQYYFVKGSKAYILTLTCTTDTYDEYSEVGEAILNSFSLK